MNIETVKIDFVEKAKILLKVDPYICISDLLVEHKVIPPIRRPRPTPELIESYGYRHDGIGNILSRSGKIMKGTTNGKYKNMPEHLQNQKYKIISLSIPGYGTKAPYTTQWIWSCQAHTLVFALVHRRYPRDGYVIDHIDDDRFNNHPDNLRECTSYENNYAIKDAEKNDIELNNMNNIATLTNFFN